MCHLQADSLRPPDLPRKAAILEVEGCFWLPLSYSVPTRSMLQGITFGWTLGPLRAACDFVPIRFQRSCHSSIRYTRGAVPCRTDEVRWQEVRSVIAKKG